MPRKNAIIPALLLFLLIAASCHGGIDLPPEDADVADVGDSDVDSGPSCPGGCPSGQFCRDGTCVGTCTNNDQCPSPAQCCGGACINTREDVSNCGGCGNDCAPYGDDCIGGVCACNGAMSCVMPMLCCGTDGCIDPDTNEDHCGGCNNPCSGGCVEGVCETCTADAHETTGGNTCADAEPLGNLADSGDQQVISGNLYPDGDSDCYWFTANDSDDAECDTFHVDIRFNENPEDQFAIEVFRGSCESPECASEPYTHYSWATDFISGTGESARGECPCRPESVDGTQTCSDNTAVFRFCVVRVSGSAAGCAFYEVEVSNGVHHTGEA